MNAGPTVTNRLADDWAARVRERRAKLKLTQAALSELSGVSQQAISLLEAGKHLPHDETKIALARAMATTPGDLFPWPSMKALIGMAS